jgi:hypothetical protein
MIQELRKYDNGREWRYVRVEEGRGLAKVADAADPANVLVDRVGLEQNQMQHEKGCYVIKVEHKSNFFRY